MIPLHCYVVFCVPSLTLSLPKGSLHIFVLQPLLVRLPHSINLPRAVVNSRGVARPPLPYFAFTIHNAGRVKIDIYKKVRVWRFHFIRMRRTGRDYLVGCRSPVLGLGPYFCRASAISTLFCKPRILHILFTSSQPNSV
jgi:hypothetical protein